MGKTMAKKDVIWGEQHSVSLASFSSAHMANIVDLIQQQIGPKEAINHSGAQSAILKAKANPKMKNGYVKVGLIGSDLILRCKEKKFLGDIEVDAILVKGYRSKVQLWKTQKAMDDLERVVNERAEREKRLKAEREEAERKEKAAQLHKVMNTPDEEGDTLRTKILRAADKAQKLGVGDYAKKKLEAQGLTPMQEDYHGEVLDHKKNRYGRYLPQLRKVWEEQGPKSGSFAKWLDDVEANKTEVPGVKEAHELTHPELRGKVVQPGGVAGGVVDYLDTETRKPYVATVRKGVITGENVKDGTLIFVIGPDSKIYAGSKARGTAGGNKAFNHSSFFSGGPVRSAGTMKVSGGKIVEVSNESGHYAPTETMMLQALTKFASGDRGWLKEVQVRIQGKKPVNGQAFMGIEDVAPKVTPPTPTRTKTVTPESGPKATTRQQPLESVEELAKFSVGPMTREEAQAILEKAPDGSWLIRVGTGNRLVFSLWRGGKHGHDFLPNVAKTAPDRNKLLLPSQVTALKEKKAPRRRSSERQQRETEGEQTGTTSGN